MELPEAVGDADEDSEHVLEEIKHRLSRKSSLVETALTDTEADLVGPETAVDSLNNRDRFQRKFFALIVATLNAASRAAGAERESILEQLSRSLSARIEPQVIAYFLADHSIRLGQHYGNRHYFNLAAEGFGAKPERYFSWRCDVAVSALRSNALFHEIYALLFHFWIFKPGTADVKSINLLLSGAEKLFQKDLNAKTFVFRPIYQMFRRVINSHQLWYDSVEAVIMEIWRLYAAFSFFYEKEHRYVVYNHNQFHLQQLLHSAKEQGDGVLVLRQKDYVSVDLADAFVRIIVAQLSLVKNEMVLLRYLTFIGHVFSQLTLSNQTALFLHAELYGRSKPGNPYYLPDNARAVASQSLKMVFPRGSTVRTIISLLFRFLQPYYFVRSIILFFLTFVCCSSVKKKRRLN